MDKSKSHTQINRLQTLEWGLLGLGLMAITITEAYAWYVTFGLALITTAFVLRGWRMRRLIPHTGLEVPGLLFAVSTGFAAWISYDPSAAWLQAVRIFAAMALFYAVVDSDQGARNKIATGFASAGAFLAIYWIQQHDFTGGQAKFAFIDSIGAWINHWLPGLPGPSIHSNVAAGSLVIALPFAVIGAWQAWKKAPRGWYGGIYYLLCTGMILLGLFLTSSRGAWVGLAGVIGLVVLVWIQRQWFSSTSRRAVFWAVSLGLVVVLLLGLIISGSLGQLLGQLPDPTGTFQGRMSLWGQGLDLIRDYFYTGSGLMSFRMTYAIYGILIHVPHHDHLHNTYLEVWLEQGVFGAISLVWGLLMVMMWAWKAFGRKQVNVWEWAGLAAVAAASIHGIFDVVFYVTRTLPLIGLVVGFAACSDPTGIRVAKTGSIRPRWLEWGGAGLLLACAVLAFNLPVLSSIYANIGTVTQARKELVAYDAAHFDNPTLDLVRRNLDLTPVEQAYQWALEWDGANPSALRRMAMISLSKGEYERALQFARRAWDAGQRDEITRLVYGDALTADGQPDQAAEVLRGLGWAPGRLAFQAAYRYEIGVPPGNPDYQRCVWAWRTVLALNPSYEGAAEALLKAEAKLNP